MERIRAENFIGIDGDYTFFGKLRLMLALTSRVLREEQELIDAIIKGEAVGHYYLLIGEKVSTYLVVSSFLELIFVAGNWQNLDDT